MALTAGKGEQALRWLHTAQGRALGFLTSLAHCPLQEQFRLRRIGCIDEVPSSIHGYMGVCTRHWSWRINVKFDDSLNEKLKTVGHELAHTFEFIDDEGMVIVPPYARYSHRANELKQLREAFCDFFADAWLEKGKIRDELERLFLYTTRRGMVYRSDHTWADSKAAFSGVLPLECYRALPFMSRCYDE